MPTTKAAPGGKRTTIADVIPTTDDHRASAPHRIRARAGNNRIIGVGETYSTRRAAIRGARRAFPGAVLRVLEG